MTKKKKFYLVSLGCAKNTVDSDSMAQILINDGYTMVDKEQDAGILIVNTCGFIGPAKEESIEVLNDLSSRKKKDQLLIAAGCLTQRYGVEVAQKVPGIDGILGTRRWMDIAQLTNQLRGSRHPQPIYHLPDDAMIGTDERGVTRASLNGSSAYLKIADGCRRPCAFCAIPLIKGTLVSRPVDSILAEAAELQELGTRELILIAQDTTDYAHDRGEKEGLVNLLRKLNHTAPKIDWLRVMYSFPGYVTDGFIDLMAEGGQLLPYFDIPLQHANSATLTRMKRPSNMDWVDRTIDKMRSRIPNLAIRTTFIVGYPGETDQEFADLIKFIKDIRFDRVGAFQFSFEPGTSSEPLGDDIPADIKQARWEELMETQQAISLEINQALVGKQLEILVEGYDNGISFGRSYRDAPEIDGLVLVEGQLPLGEIVPVRVTGAMAYDLNAVPIRSEKSKPIDLH